MKQMALRHAGACRVCGLELAAKTTAIYDFTAKNVLCLACAGESATTDPSVPARPVEHAGTVVASRRTQERRVGDRRRSTQGA